MDSVLNHTILIVDDDTVNLSTLFQALKDQYNVIAANSGQLAISKAQSEKPDLILLDVMMPEMDGYEVLAKIRESDLTSSIPVIFITGLGDAVDEEKGFALGAVDYITKPFNINVVRARVNAHVNIARQVRTAEEIGMTDALTKIANRRKFDRQLDWEWARSVRGREPISLLMLDIDKFKVFNDTYGHQQGDEVLREIAKTLSSSVKRVTDLAARWGGEEFAVMLSNTAKEYAMSIAETIRSNVEATRVPNLSGGPDLTVTVSIGVSTIIPSAEDRIEDLIAKADQALYDAKNAGRNNARFCE